MSNADIDADRHAAQRGLDDVTEVAIDCAIEDMKGANLVVYDFLADEGPDLSMLISLLMSRGLPSMNGSERDDRYADRLYTLISKIEDDFAAWAEHVPHIGKSRVQKWMDATLEESKEYGL